MIREATALEPQVPIVKRPGRGHMVFIGSFGKIHEVCVASTGVVLGV